MARQAKRRHLGHTKNDSDPYKAFPASIAALVAALRQNWGAMSGDLPSGTVQSRPDFNKNPPKSFAAAVEKVADRLKGLQHKTGQATSITKLETGGGTENTQPKDRVYLHYWHLRVLSDWVGLSVSQFVMASHFISVERRAENEKKSRIAELKRLHDQYSRVLCEIETLIEEGETSGKPILYTVVEGETHKYHPNEEFVARLVQAAGREKPD
jgi:hypothetical protein